MTQEEFKSCYLCNFKSFQNFANKITCRSNISGEDLLSEATLRALQGLDLYREQGYFKAWFMQIIHNTFVSMTRLKRYRQFESLSDGSLDEPCLQPEIKRLNTALKIIKSRLSEKQFYILMLAGEGFKIREIVEMTRLPEGSVKGIIHRSRELIEPVKEQVYDLI